MVIDILNRREIEFWRIRPGNYGRKLNELVRHGEPERAIDRMVVAWLIEACSFKRSDFLRKYMDGKNQEVSDFYGSLFESEARHHTTCG